LFKPVQFQYILTFTLPLKCNGISVAVWHASLLACAALTPAILANAAVEANQCRVPMQFSI